MPMTISLINHTNGKIPDEEVQCVIRAVNRQVAEDFEPYWGYGARLRLEGKVGKAPNKQTLSDMRGDSVIYLWDKMDIDDAVGYHDTNFRGIPYGFVFLEVAKKLGEPWSVTLSHEVLELVGDPMVNLLVQGPHPAKAGKMVFHWFEMCDAVQDETYEIDGVRVSNFVLPSYFTDGEQAGSRNDFLGRLHGGKALLSFGVSEGGYLGFYDPELNDYDSFAPSLKARRRLEIKSKAKEARRSWRYRHGDSTKGCLPAPGDGKPRAVPRKQAAPAGRPARPVKEKA
jgi:hypothetical protein